MLCGYNTAEQGRRGREESWNCGHRRALRPQGPEPLSIWRKDSEAAVAATTSALLSPRKGTESVGQNTSRAAFQQWPSGEDG